VQDAPEAIGQYSDNEEKVMSTAGRANDMSADESGKSASTVSDKISDGIDEVARSASRFSDRLRSNAGALHEDLSAAGERFGDGAKRLGTVASEQIRAHPLAAVGIAVAAGFVVSRLMRRR
jgi:ElaB/YqjD/DUF883 family membrane-anchored ribosome-binding protein